MKRKQLKDVPDCILVRFEPKGKWFRYNHIRQPATTAKSIISSMGLYQSSIAYEIYDVRCDRWWKSRCVYRRYTDTMPFRRIKSIIKKAPVHIRPITVMEQQHAN